MNGRPKRVMGRWALSGKGLVAIFLWGSSFVLTRIALRSMDPVALVALRLALGTGLLVLLLQIRGGPFLPSRRDMGACILLGLVLGVHLLIQAFGLQYTSAIHTGWIIGFIPVTIALGAHLLGKQRIGGRGWLGIAVGAAGIGVVTLASSPGFEQARFGDVLQILSCLTWTVYTLVGVTPIARSGALRVTVFASGVASVVVLTALPWTGLSVHQMTVEAWLAVVALGLLCSGLAYYLWFQAISEHGPARTGSLLYLEPLVTLAAAVAILGERVTVHVIVGGVGVLAGVWLVARGTPIPDAAELKDQATDHT